MAKSAVQYASGTFGQGTEWLHDVLYDRLILASAGPMQTSLFRNKAGDSRNNVVLSLADTNVIASQVPVAQKWYLWELKVSYLSALIKTDAAWQLVLDYFRSTVIQFSIQNIDKMFTIPLDYFMPTTQMVAAPAATVNSAYPYTVAEGKWILKVPEVLEQNAVWWLDVIQLSPNGAALNGDYVRFAFDREMYRQGG